MSDAPQAPSPLTLARQQMGLARQQAVALIASIDAALGSMPQEAPEPRKRFTVLGEDDQMESA